MDGLDTIIGVVKDVGFPIFVAVYMMVFMKKALLKLTATNEEIIRILRRSVGA